MVTGYIHLKTCNYSGALKLVQTFKSRYSGRVNSLTQLSKMKITPELNFALQKFSTEDLSWENLHEKVDKLPRLFHRDKQLAKLFKIRKKRALKKLSLSKNTYKIKRRFKALAKADLKEMGQVVRSLHILEAEATQRSYKINNVKLAKSIDSNDSAQVLVFPQDKEVWLDEVDNYRVSHGGCPTKKETQL